MIDSTCPFAIAEAEENMILDAARDLGILHETWRHEQHGATDRDRAHTLGELAKASDTLRSFMFGDDVPRRVSIVEAVNTMRTLNRHAPGTITETISNAFEIRRRAVEIDLWEAQQEAEGIEEWTN